MTSDLLALTDRLQMRFDRESGLKAIDETVLKYGYVQGNRFSFHEHEFQQQIIKGGRLCPLSSKP